MRWLPRKSDTPKHGEYRGISSQGPEVSICDPNGQQPRDLLGVPASRPAGVESSQHFGSQDWKQSSNPNGPVGRVRPIEEQPGDADLQLSHPCQQIEGRPKILEVPGRSRGAMLCSSVTATFVSSFEHLACN